MSSLIDAPKFGARTGISRHRLDALWYYIRFSDQTDEHHEGVTSVSHRWILVDNFVEACNEYRAA